MRRVLARAPSSASCAISARVASGGSRWAVVQPLAGERARAQGGRGGKIPSAKASSAAPEYSPSAWALTPAGNWQ